MLRQKKRLLSDVLFHSADRVNTCWAANSTRHPEEKRCRQTVRDNRFVRAQPLQNVIQFFEYNLFCDDCDECRLLREQILFFLLSQNAETAIPVPAVVKSPALFAE